MSATPTETKAPVIEVGGPPTSNGTRTSIVDRFAQWGSHPAVIAADGVHISYGDLAARIASLADTMGPTRALVLIEARNELPALLGYLACLHGRHPVMLVPHGRDELDELVRTYRPAFVVSASVDGTWALRRVDQPSTGELHPDLAVLLSTAGSTGSPKVVRLSYANIEANAASIATYLQIRASDRAITSLPFHYSHGLSVLNSYFRWGATVLLTDASVVEPAFWEFFSANGGTSLAAVPYTFELLDRVEFDEILIPSLRYITAVGGRLAPEMVTRYAAMGRKASRGRDAGWDLFVTYGQTEATAAMSFVPPALVERFPASIGVPIPDGAFSLRDERGRTITESGRQGELIYTGPNVMMGYARNREDLKLGCQHSELATGDLAVRDERGVYSVVGRKNRVDEQRPNAARLITD